MKKNIGLSAICFNEQPSGAKQRFIGINKELIKKLSDCQFFIIEPEDYNISKHFSEFKNIKVIKTSFNTKKKLAYQIKKYFFSTPKLIKEYNLDIYENSVIPVQKIKNCKNILTIHDLRMLYKEYNSLYKIYKYIFSYSMNNSNHLIAVSNQTKQDILSFRGHPQIDVIPNGIDIEKFYQVKEFQLSKVKKKFSLPKNFLLAVGHLEPRKNYINLIKAYKNLKIIKNISPLFIVGNDKGQKDELFNLIAELQLEKSVFICSGITDEELICFYKLSTLVVFISYLEGFGIPILEAMASGKPILLSDIKVFRDLTENRYIYVNPFNIQEISNAIMKMLENEFLINKQISYNNERVKEFSYSQISNKVVDIYSSLINL